MKFIYQLRIYHTEVSSGKKWVWRPDGYSPSEPFFVSNPMPTAEDDGVVVTLASPMSTERDDLEPFFAILNGRDLTELARAYLPKGYTLPVGFHGIYVQAEKPWIWSKSSLSTTWYIFCKSFLRMDSKVRFYTDYLSDYLNKKFYQKYIDFTADYIHYSNKNISGDKSYLFIFFMKLLRSVKHEK